MVCAALAAGCAPATKGEVDDVSGARARGTVSGSTVRVDESPVSILVFPGADMEDVWKVLPASFSALGIPAGVMDASNHAYGSQLVKVTKIGDRRVEQLFRCAAGEGLSAATYRVEFGIVVQPRKLAGGGTELTVETAALGRMASMGRAGNTHCVSNGLLEKQLQSQIETELDRAGN
jgi:hypothetical protein